MKKRLLLLVAALLPLLASADPVEINGIWYNLIPKAKQAEVTQNPSGYTGHVEIPSTVNYDGKTYDVTSIGEYAFYYCSSLTSITIPESIISVGEQAFNTCRSLIAINIPKSVTSIGEGAFASCESLTTINIPENSQLTSIGNGAFSDCSSLTSVNIPDGVTSIGEIAFWSCSSLTTINIPENSQLTSIGFAAFSGCSILTSITIPESVTSIGNEAFSNCRSLTSITIPSKITYIGSSTFSGCSSLTTIDIPESVMAIGNYAFNYCSSLVSVAMPKRVYLVGDYAFYGCSSLTSITIPKIAFSEDRIGDKAFANCTELTDVYCYADVVPYNTSISAFEGSYPEYMTLHVPVNLLNEYKSTAPWSSFGKFETIAAGIINIPSKPVLITEQGGTLVLSGLVDGTEVAVYDMMGTEFATAVVANGTATLATSLGTGSTAIVKIGTQSVKVLIK